MSHVAIVGFVAGAAIVIGLQQLKGLFGITHFTTKTDIISFMKAVWEAFHNPVYFFPYSFTFSYFVTYINSIYTYSSKKSMLIGLNEQVMNIGSICLSPKISMFLYSTQIESIVSLAVPPLASLWPYDYPISTKLL
jgi:MFS superfamily sulfate permease-like transporter